MNKWNMLKASIKDIIKMTEDRRSDDPCAFMELCTLKGVLRMMEIIEESEDEEKKN